MIRDGTHYQVEGECGGFWGVEQEYFRTRREAEQYANSRSGLWRVIRVSREQVASGLTKAPSAEQTVTP